MEAAMKALVDMQMDVLRALENLIVDAELSDIIDRAVKAEAAELEEKEAAAELHKRMHMSEEERITESTLYLKRLLIERVVQRRHVGKRITFLS